MMMNLEVNDFKTLTNLLKTLREIHTLIQSDNKLLSIRVFLSF